MVGMLGLVKMYSGGNAGVSEDVRVFVEENAM